MAVVTPGEVHPEYVVRISRMTSAPSKDPSSPESNPVVMSAVYLPWASGPVTTGAITVVPTRHCTFADVMVEYGAAAFGHWKTIFMNEPPSTGGRMHEEKLVI